MQNDNLKNLGTKFKAFVSTEIFFYSAIVLAATLIFCISWGPRVLIPTYVDWLMAGGDLSQHYIGWNSFRNSPWLFPFGMTRQLTYPFATSVIFTDSIPLFAVFFKILSPILPNNFQYFGLFGLITHILQGLLGAKILRLFIKNKWQIFLGSIFFAASPLVIYRMFMHTALAGQWVLLLAIYALLVEGLSLKKETILWALIGFLTSSIHIYFLGMNGIILAGLCLKKILQKKGAKSFFLPPLAFLGASLLTLYLLGGFSSEVIAASAAGLGYFSMNLNALFSSGDWGCLIWKKLPKLEGQYEGFSYLGAGMIPMFLLAIVAFFFVKRRTYLKETWKTWLPIMLVFGAEFVFALSNKVAIGKTVLFTVPLPDVVKEYWGIFRSTGRFSWVCLYLIFVFSLVIIHQIPKKYVATIIIALALLIQLIDMKPVFDYYRSIYNQTKVHNPKLLQDPGWKSIAEDDKIKHIFVATNIPKPELYVIANMALKNHKTMNRFNISHGDQSFFTAKFRELVRHPQQDSVYIFRASGSRLPPYNLQYRRAGLYWLGFAPASN